MAPVRLGLGLRGGGVHDDAVDADAAGDVLQLVLAQVLERKVELAAYLVVDLGRDADSAGAGERLDARRDIDAVAVDPVSLDHEVAEIDADPERHAALFGQFCIARSQFRLEGEGRFDRVYRAAEFRQNVVPRHVHDAAMLRCHNPGDDAAEFRQGAHGGELVVAHQAAVARDIGAQYGGEPALHGAPRNVGHGRYYVGIGRPGLTPRA